MAQRHNHYELAFEQYLREKRVPYVAVDEQRRSLMGNGSLKSLDYLLTPGDGASLLVDIKGRRFPSGAKNKQYWRNWSTWDDLESMAQWQRQWGAASEALLVFAYEVVGPRAPVEPRRLYSCRERLYAFLAVRIADYIQGCRPLSAKWQTVSMPLGLFRQAAFPIDTLLDRVATAERAAIHGNATPEMAPRIPGVSPCSAGNLV